MYFQLLTLPNELVYLVAENLGPKDVNALVQTCRSLELLLTPLLHKHALEDKDGTSALHWASVHGHLPLARVVLENGGKLDDRDEFGKTPLHQAASSGYKKLVRLLLDRGADAFAQDHMEDMPIHIAAQRQRDTIVKMFLDHGVGPNVLGNRGNTPLHQAMQCSGDLWIPEYPDQEQGVIRLLLDHGADAMIENEDGRIASWYTDIFLTPETSDDEVALEPIETDNFVQYT